MYRVSCKEEWWRVTNFQCGRAYNRGMDLVELVPVEIAEALERGATVVTGNQRAARALRRGFDRRNRAAGMESWRPPAVMAWGGRLEEHTSGIQSHFNLVCRLLL